jgi:RNA polymerase sigma-70 factor (ECF subfamily)
MSHARTIEGMRLETAANQGDDLARLRARDASTWEAFFDRMYPRMLAYAERRVGSREDARDAVSETFARMVKSIDGLTRPNVTADGWCFGILHHVVADLQRRTYRRRKGMPSDIPSVGEPSDPLVLADEHQAVRAAFAHLSRRDRDVLELRVVAGLCAEEVALILSMRPGAVRMAQVRALERLRAGVEIEGDAP